MQETWVWSLGWEDPWENSMAAHSSILAWRIPWTEEPGGLQSMGPKDSDMTERLSTAHSCHLCCSKQKALCQPPVRTPPPPCPTQTPQGSICRLQPHHILGAWACGLGRSVSMNKGCFYMLSFKKFFYFVLGYSQLTMLWEFQVAREGIQPYIHVYSLSPKFPSQPGQGGASIWIFCFQRASGLTCKLGVLTLKHQYLK